MDLIKIFENVRWRGNVESPFDSSSKVYYCGSNKFRCRNTQKYFNFKTGTALSGIKIPLQVWVMFFKNNFSSTYDIARKLKLTQKSAWRMLQLDKNNNCEIYKKWKNYFKNENN